MGVLAVILAAFGAEGAVKPENNLPRETKRLLSKSELRSYAPYVGDGLKEAMKDNWRFILDAYGGKAEWPDALIQTGTDIAGYTVTPVLVDGVIAASKSQFSVILREAEIGIFCWSMGKEFFSYSKGDINYDTMRNRIAESAAKELPVMPVNVLAYLITKAGYSFLSPVVVIAGTFAIERVSDWYEFQRWKNTVYVEDIKAVLGEDLINVFNLASPEYRYNLADPETHSSLTNQEQRKSIANP